MLGDGSSREQIDEYPVRGTVLRDRFVLEEELEHGRFGNVYKAVDLHRASADGTRDHVGVLVLPAEAVRNGDVLEAFRRELGRLQALNHPHIIKVFDFDRDGPVHFVTMEHVDGESLRAIVDSLRPERLWQHEAVAVVRAIGDALAYAHSRGVVHGDVRLENVIVTAQHDVKVLFTSACIAGSAPFTVEPHDDVRGLATVAYELLAGEPPFLRPAAATAQGPVEPKRIDSMSRHQWKVLRGILLGRDDRLSGVAELLEALPTAATGREAEDEHNVRAGRPSWRWVAVAWAAVLLGVAYMLTGGDPAEPPETGTAEPQAEAPDAPPAATAGSAQASLAAASQPTVDGRLPPRELAGAALESIAPAAAAADSAAANGSAAGSLSTVTFSQSSLTVAESEGVASLEIRRDGGLDRSVRVVWWTSAGTAQPAEDFADLGYVTETLRSGEQRRRILIPITSDRLEESREEFRVHLRADGDDGLRLGAIAQVTVTIVDDDS